MTFKKISNIDTFYLFFIRMIYDSSNMFYFYIIKSSNSNDATGFQSKFSTIFREEMCFLNISKRSTFLDETSLAQLKNKN